MTERRKRWLAALGLAAGIAILAFPLVLAKAVSLTVARLLPGGGRVEMVDLGFDRLSLRNVAADDGSVSAETVLIRFRITDLVRGRLEHVLVEGLRLEVPLGGPPRGPSSRASLPAVLPVAEIAEASVTDATLALRSDAGTIALPFSAFAAYRGGHGEGRVVFDGPVLSLDASFALTSQGANLRSDDGARLEMATLPPALARRIPPPLAAGLAAPLSLSVIGIGGKPLEIGFRQSGGRLAVTGGFHATLAAASGSRLSIDTAGTAEFGDGAAPSRLSARWLTLDVANLRLPMVTVDARVRVQEFGGSLPLGEAAASLHVLARNLRTPSIAAEEVSLETRGQLRLDENGLAYVIDSPGRLWVAGLAATAGFALSEPLTLLLRPAERPLLDIASHGSPRLRMNVNAEPAAAARLAVAANAPTLILGAERLTIDGTVGAADGQGAWKLSVHEGDAKLAGHSGELRKISATLRLAEALEVDVRSGELRHPAVVPLLLSASLRPDGGGWALRGNLHDAEGHLVIEANGRHDAATASGAVGLTAKPLVFVEGGLQPAELFPIIAGHLTAVSGRLAATGKIAWTDKGISQLIDLLVEDVGCTVGGVAISRVNTVVRFDGLAPFATPPNQFAAVGLVDAGLPLTDGELAFRVSGSRLFIDDARLRLAGGQMTVADAVFDPRAPEQRFALHVSGVDLAEIVNLIGVDGLDATGRLGGAIPVVITRDRVLIQNGRLAASGPGRLRYRPAERPAAPQGGGQPVDIMLKALDDFHYRALVLTLAGQAGGEVEALLHVEGSNPSLYEGYPLEFNLSLQGKLDSILQESLAGYQIPDRIRERMMKFGPP